VGRAAIHGERSAHRGEPALLAHQPWAMSREPIGGETCALSRRNLG
jgi:hypothetical protein